MNSHTTVDQITNNDVKLAKRKPELIASRPLRKERSLVLTIAIAAYQHESFIQECLSGLVNCRNRSEIEILFLDDCSSDRTVSIARELLETSDANFRIYQNINNMGLTYGLDFLLSKARGSFFISCASDDRINGEALDRLLDQLKMNPGPEALEICAAEYFGDGTGLVYDAKMMEAVTQNPTSFYRWLSLGFPRPLLLQSTIFRTNFLRKVDPWKKRLILDDWPTFLMAARIALKEGVSVSFNPDLVLTGYRMHKGGLHKDTDRQRRACLEVVEKVVSKEFRNLAKANVLSDIAVIDLVERRYFAALRGYILSLAAYPSPKTAARLPLRVFSSVVKRTARKLRIRLTTK